MAELDGLPSHLQRLAPCARLHTLPALQRLHPPPKPALTCSKVAELDGGLEKLKERAARLTKASKKYSGALDAAALGTAAFADRCVRRRACGLLLCAVDGAAGLLRHVAC